MPAARGQAHVDQGLQLPQVQHSRAIARRLCAPPSRPSRALRGGSRPGAGRCPVVPRLRRFGLPGDQCPNRRLGRLPARRRRRAGATGERAAGREPRPGVSTRPVGRLAGVPADHQCRRDLGQPTGRKDLLAGGAARQPDAAPGVALRDDPSQRGVRDKVPTSSCLLGRQARDGNREAAHSHLPCLATPQQRDGPDRGPGRTRGGRSARLPHGAGGGRAPRDRRRAQRRQRADLRPQRAEGRSVEPVLRREDRRQSRYPRRAGAPRPGACRRDQAAPRPRSHPRVLPGGDIRGRLPLAPGRAPRHAHGAPPEGRHVPRQHRRGGWPSVRLAGAP
jgi:hypothetical protein